MKLPTYTRLQDCAWRFPPFVACAGQEPPPYAQIQDCVRNLHRVFGHICNATINIWKYEDGREKITYEFWIKDHGLSPEFSDWEEAMRWYRETLEATEFVGEK